MKNKLHLGRGVAILACAASLAGTAAVVAPSAASAATSCGNKSVKIKQEGAKPFNYPVKAIYVEGGATCAEATKVISGVLAGEPPSAATRATNATIIAGEGRRRHSFCNIVDSSFGRFGGGVPPRAT